MKNAVLSVSQTIKPIEEALRQHGPLSLVETAGDRLVPHPIRRLFLNDGDLELLASLNLS